MEIFWKTISDYNISTWYLQILILLAGLFLTIILYRKPMRIIQQAMKLYMVFVNLWVAAVYYMIYGATRQYYYIFAIFWGIVACIWFYDLLKGDYTFERSYKFDKIAYVIYALPFIYPIISLSRGMQFPAITSPVMPCTVSIFTIGLLLSFSKKINLFLVLFLFHWALLGVAKIYLYKIPEDIILAIFTIPAVFLYLRESINSGIAVETKPGAKTINALLLGVCSIVGLVLSYVVISSFGLTIF